MTLPEIPVFDNILSPPPNHNTPYRHISNSKYSITLKKYKQQKADSDPTHQPICYINIFYSLNIILGIPRSGMFPPHPLVCHDKTKNPATD